MAWGEQQRPDAAWQELRARAERAEARVAELTDAGNALMDIVSLQTRSNGAWAKQVERWRVLAGLESR